MKCKEGICAGLERLTIYSPLYETQYGMCKDDDDKFTQTKFFMEPAHVGYNY